MCVVLSKGKTNRKTTPLKKAELFKDGISRVQLAANAGYGIRKNFQDTPPLNQNPTKPSLTIQRHPTQACRKPLLPSPLKTKNTADEFHIGKYDKVYPNIIRRRKRWKLATNTKKRHPIWGLIKRSFTWGDHYKLPMMIRQEY